MAVVELGTWCLRAGYVGDPACTRCPRALCARACPEELDFMSMLNTASGASTSAESGATRGLAQLWSLPAWQREPELHMRHLRHIKCDALGCSAEDALLLVVPEAWHERLDVMTSLFAAVFEESGLTPRLYCCRPSVCWALANGCASAVVLDIGHTHSTVAAVMDGYVLRHTVTSVEVGGADVTAAFAAGLASSGAPGSDVVSQLVQAYPHLLHDDELRGRFGEDVVSDIKHVYGFVRHHGVDRAVPASVEAASPSCAASQAAAGAVRLCTSDGKSQAATGVVSDEATASVALRMPDGAALRLSAEQCTEPFEVLFGATSPLSRAGTPRAAVEAAAVGDGSGVSVAAMLVRCKQQLDTEWQARTVPHIVAGAGGRVTGLCARVLAEAKMRDASYFRYEAGNAMQVARSEEGAWAGASLAAASSSFGSLWVSRAEWEEEGTGVLCRKLFY